MNLRRLDSVACGDDCKEILYITDSGVRVTTFIDDDAGIVTWDVELVEATPIEATDFPPELLQAIGDTAKDGQRRQSLVSNYDAIDYPDDDLADFAPDYDEPDDFSSQFSIDDIDPELEREIDRELRLRRQKMREMVDQD